MDRARSRAHQFKEAGLPGPTDEPPWPLGNFYGTAKFVAVVGSLRPEETTSVEQDPK
jgi:hypothetical protein